MRNVLFICGRNKWRSPTAEQVFSEHPAIQCASAGLSRDAEVPVSIELIEWAELIFVMEKQHRSKLLAQFKPQLRSKKLVCLDIPDNYKFMEPALVRLLERKVTPFLPAAGRA
ncbi:MAG: low molecular weight protein tyrosine phosphatase family protein [Stagnimonas sp.]|nr:low molecular weight protein tyrosine phosphatase family protein [Stagnimonas sp.]